MALLMLSAATVVIQRRRAGHGMVTLLLPLCVLSSTVQAAGPVAAGDDLLTTAGTTRLHDISIPGEFFGTNSDPIPNLTALLTGVPLSPTTGTADTIVRRTAAAAVSTNGSSDTVPIEIIALHLVSVNPITVTYNGGGTPQQWSIDVCLRTTPQPGGSMTIMRTHSNGGTVTATTLPVDARVNFTLLTPPNTLRTLNHSVTLTLASPPAYWVDQSTTFGVPVAGANVDRLCDGTPDIAVSTSNFLFGVRQVAPGEGPSDCQVIEVSEEQSATADHDVRIPGFPSASCCAPNGACSAISESGAQACQSGGGKIVSDGCAPTGACCFADGSCTPNATQCCCDVQGGDYKGDGVPCAPNGRCIPTLSEWGVAVMAFLLLAAATIIVRRRPQRGSVGVLLAAFLLLIGGHRVSAGTSPCEDCGPGAHWIDSCAANTDTMPATVGLIGVDLDMDGIADTTLQLQGPVTIVRTNPLDDSIRFPGLRSGTPGHLDVIDTEITSMRLVGGGGIVLRAGLSAPGLVGSIQQTFGAIAEDTDPRNAQSFFDVYFELELGAGSYAYNHVAVRHEITIDCVPPGPSIYSLVTPGPIPLFSQPVGGVVVAQLVTGGHAVDSPTVSTWGVAVMALLVMSAATVVIQRRRAAFV